MNKTKIKSDTIALSLFILFYVIIPLFLMFDYVYFHVTPHYLYEPLYWLTFCIYFLATPILFVVVLIWMLDNQNKESQSHE